MLLVMSQKQKKAACKTSGKRWGQTKASTVDCGVLELEVYAPENVACTTPATCCWVTICTKNQMRLNGSMLLNRTSGKDE